MNEDIVLCSRLIQRRDLPHSNRRLVCHFAENTIDDDILLSFANNKSNDFLGEQFESYPIDTDFPVYFESSSDSNLSHNFTEGASRPDCIFLSLERTLERMLNFQHLMLKGSND